MCEPFGDEIKYKKNSRILQKTVKTFTNDISNEVDHTFRKNNDKEEEGKSTH